MSRLKEILERVGHAAAKRLDWPLGCKVLVVEVERKDFAAMQWEMGSLSDQSVRVPCPGSAYIEFVPKKSVCELCKQALP